MGAFDLKATMTGLATLARNASLAKQVYDFPTGKPAAPCVIVGYPTTIDFDLTMARGGDRADLPVWFLVGRKDAEGTRDALSTILADVSSVKSTFDGAQSFGDVRVTDAKVVVLPIGLPEAPVEYMAVEFSVEIAS